MGAKVLHPPSIQPARRHRIPIYIKDTRQPEFAGTCISAQDREAQAQVKGVVSRAGITLINMENPAMWQQAGFLADAFSVFKLHGYSVDLISTSESTVTVSLDPESAVDSDGTRFEAFIRELSDLCRVEVRRDCVSISLVGNSIRTILGKISAALDVFQDRNVHLVTQSANDLNLTLVVDAEHADILVRKLHQLLIAAQAESRAEFGPSWTELNHPRGAPTQRIIWWKSHAAALISAMQERESAYVYYLSTMRSAVHQLQSLSSIKRVLYSVKANDHERVLRLMAAEGLGFECVSLAELQHVSHVVPGVQPQEILFTPNFAPRSEYR
ncbi:MAG: bifunctional aspartate kinase/diaminopimelate decarboxylase, partial [Lysobacterales bacterium]